MFERTNTTFRYVAAILWGTILICIYFYSYTGNTNLYVNNYTQQQTKASPKNGSGINSYASSSTHSFQTKVIDDRRTENINIEKENIWISMGLCFEKNTERYGKKTYPYTKVTPLAIMLWNYFLPWVKIILYVIYDKNANKEHRILYDSQLKQNIDTNMVQIRWVEEGNMSCPTKSQLIRMWAFQEPMVKNDDIIVTVDANLFVMTPKILIPLSQNSNKTIWIFQWDRAAFKTEGIGETFNQNLIAAKPKGTIDINNFSFSQG